MVRLMRVAKSKARKDGKPRVCGKCRKEIPVGAPYQHWAFRYGGKYTRCMDCTPAPWELESNAKRAAIMQGQYHAGRAADEATADDAAAAIRDAVGCAEEARDEFQGALDAWSGTGLENTEQYQQFENAVYELDDWISEADSAADELEGWQPEEAEVEEVVEGEEEIEPEEDESWREIAENLADFPEPDF